MSWSIFLDLTINNNVKISGENNGKQGVYHMPEIKSPEKNVGLCLTPWCLHTSF